MENKEQIKLNTPNQETNKNNEITIDFSKFSAWLEEKSKPIEINTTKIREEKESKIGPMLWSSWIKQQALNIKRKLTNIEKIAIYYFISFGCIIAIVLMGVYNKYILLASTNTEIKEENRTFIEKVKEINQYISKYTKINKYASRLEQWNILIQDNAETSVKQIINSNRLNYIHKKDILGKNIVILENDIINNTEKLDIIKKEIVKYWFIPQQLYNSIEEQHWIYGIKERMALMENLKLITSFKVFSYMDSFIQGFANLIDEDPIIVEDKIKTIITNWEKHVTNYTNNCFLNPYEINENCTTINDFNNYYKRIDTTSKIDTNFIKQLANYINIKLLETDIPTFNINFLWFNPKDDKIEFIIELNTNIQDEMVLNKQWIINPHVFIATNLIIFLKQSLLVIGENIKSDQIKIEPKTVKIGSTIFTINNSTIKLSLPIQKANQREISDFFSSK